MRVMRTSRGASTARSDAEVASVIAVMADDAQPSKNSRRFDRQWSRVKGIER
jgi:hypothetical protein